MSKKLMLIGLAIFTLSLTSCKKDFECDCHIDTVDGEHIDKEVDIKDAKKSDAEKMCDDIEHNFEKNENYKEVDCQLK